MFGLLLARSFLWKKQHVVMSAGCVTTSCYHHKRHPREMAGVEIGQFLDSLAAKETPLSRMEDARTDLDFLYREVLRLDVGEEIEMAIFVSPRCMENSRQYQCHHNPGILAKSSPEMMLQSRKECTGA
jgi:hypothetical protein